MQRNTFSFPFFGLLILALWLVGCDAISSNEDQNNQQASGTFEARLAGALNHTMQGTARSGQGNWGGTGFQGAVSFFPCDEGFYYEDDEDWSEEGDSTHTGEGGDDPYDDYGEMDCTASDTTVTLFFLELSPDGATTEEESIFLAYDGEIVPGTYPIADLDFEEPTQINDQTVFAEYLRTPSDKSLESYAGSSGTLTITSIEEGRVSGSFSFEANECFCISEEQLEQLFETWEAGTFDDEEEDPFEQFLVARDLTIEGTFTEVQLSDSEEDLFGDYKEEDGEHGGK